MWLSKSLQNGCRSALKTGRQGAQRGRPIHKTQQSGEESWENSDDEMYKHIYMAVIKSLSFNSIRSSEKNKAEN